MNSADLSPSQAENLRRFLGKIPKNARETVTITKLPEDRVKFSAESAGKVPGSKAIYEKLVDGSGRTISYTKTTIAPSGNTIHIKDKM